MAQNGNVGVASLLLSRSTEQLHVRDRQGRTALHLAARNGSLEVLMLLLAQGADITAADKVRLWPISFHPHFHPLLNSSK